MTAQVPAIAGRADLTVTVAPGAGRGAPACFIHASAEIEVNGDHLPDRHRRLHRLRCPAGQRGRGRISRRAHPRPGRRRHPRDGRGRASREGGRRRNRRGEAGPAPPGLASDPPHPRRRREGHGPARPPLVPHPRRSPGPARPEGRPVRGGRAAVAGRLGGRRGDREGRGPSKVGFAPPPPFPPEAAEAREAESKARRAAGDASARVFARDPGDGSGGTTGVTREPTADEQAAARRLARALREARAETVIASATPPGRLRMRHAMAADAQRAAGAMPTAKPFTRVERRRVPAPPLAVGVACDMSG
jgi:hypothetical protein